LTTIGVGVIGASPGPFSWAASTHLPALRALSGYELRAVSTSRRDVRLTEDGTPVTVTAPDQVAVTATVDGGAVLSAFYRGGVSRGDNLQAVELVRLLCYK